MTSCFISWGRKTYSKEEKEEAFARSEGKSDQYLNYRGKLVGFNENAEILASLEKGAQVDILSGGFGEEMYTRKNQETGQDEVVVNWVVDFAGFAGPTAASVAGKPKAAAAKKKAPTPVDMDAIFGSEEEIPF